VASTGSASLERSMRPDPDHGHDREASFSPGADFVDLLLSATNDGVVDWDLKGNAARYSVRWKMLLGYEDGELEDSPDLWRRLSHPADLPAVERSLRESLENLFPFLHKWRMRHRSEDWRWFLCRSVIMRDEQALPLRMVSVYSDITDQVRAEERYRALANGIPDAIFRIRTDGTILDEKPPAVPMALIRDRVGRRTLRERVTDQAFAGRILEAVGTASQSGGAVAFEHGDGDSGPCLESRVVKSGDDEAVCITRDVSARKQDERRLIDSLDRLKKAQRQLMEASHLAGMAEVASSVLHNVGNVLNSVNVSAATVGELLDQSPLDGLSMALELLATHRSDLTRYVGEDPKGMRLLPYLAQLSRVLLDDRKRARGEVESLQKNIDHIKMIVTTQQSNARSMSGATERLSPEEVVEDAIKLTSAWDGKDGIILARTYAPVPEAELDRHKVLQIVINLLTNARHAVADAPVRKVTVRLTTRGEQHFFIEVEDTGKGIPAENLTRIFNHGFTTRRDGHGFGLHGSALAAGEMGGTLVAHSAGPDQGARFVLDLPVRPPRRTPDPLATTSSSLSAFSEPADASGAPRGR
jgi:signal transduction histidine kinase